MTPQAASALASATSTSMQRAIRARSENTARISGVPNELRKMTESMTAVAPGAGPAGDADGMPRWLMASTLLQQWGCGR